MIHFIGVLKRIGIRTHRSFRLAIRAFALLLGLSAGFFVSVQIEVGHFEIAFWLFLIVTGAAVLELILGDLFADQSFPFDTERKLSLMEKRLGMETISTISRRLEETIGVFKNCDISSVSATVHLVAELNGDLGSRSNYGLLQLTDYVGPEGGRKGRLTLINQGIIGRCARTEEIETVNFIDVNEYRCSMVRDFGFTKQEASLHTTSARSYLAYPLKSEGLLIGVIYFFSDEPEVFPGSIEGAHLDQVAQEFVNYLKIVQLV